MYVYDDREIEHLSMHVAKSVYRTLTDPRVSRHTQSLPEVTIETLVNVARRQFEETLKHSGVLTESGVFDKALRG